MDSTLTSQIPSTPTVTDFVHQTFTWIAPGDAGPETIELDMDYLSFFWYQNMHLGLVYGSQLGLTALMLITLLLLTHPGKRRALIYVLNVLALVLDLIRSALMAVWLTSVWNHPVVFLLRDFTPITNQDLAASIVVNVVKTLELATILTSLIFQVRVILSTATSFQRGSILSLAFLMATVTLCVQLASTVVNSRNIVLFMPADGLQLRLADLARIMQLVSTSFFLLVFVSKLGWAIRQRVRLGQSQFGPMQMVFIGSLQSMVMPGMS
jgi:pheromone alpha factor receptor